MDSLVTLKLSQEERQQVTELAQSEGRTDSNYVRWVIQNYLANLDYSTLPNTAPKTLKGLKHNHAEGRVLNLNVRIDAEAKNQLYKVAELQGYKGATLLKELVLPNQPNSQ